MLWFRLGKFTMWKNKNISLKKSLKEKFLINHNYILIQKLNTNIYNRYPMSRKGHFLGLALYKNYKMRTTRKKKVIIKRIKIN